MRLASRSRTKKPSSTKPRLAWVDLFESLAILMVVFYHATSSIAHTDFSSVTTPHFFLFYFFRSLLAVCVPIFFFANGFLLFRKPTFDFKTHLHKTLHFVFLALFWYLITVIFLLFLHRSELSLSNPFAILAAVKSNLNHLWYLGALVCLYLFFPLLKVTYDHHPTAFLYFAILCCILTFGSSLLNELATFISYFCSSSHQVFTELNPFNIFNPLRGLYEFSFAYFCLGGLAAHFLPRLLNIPVKKRNIFAAISLIFSWFALFGLSLLYCAASGKVWDNVWYNYASVFTLLAVFALFLLCQNFSRCPKILTTISQNTLGIYLIHTLLIAATAYFGLNSFLTDFTSPLLLIFNLLYSLGVLAMSLLISLLLRRLPFIRRQVS